MLFLKQSTASQSVLIGPFVDSTDGVTAETGLTISNTDIRLSKNGGNMAAKNSGGGTHDENGWYTITLDATDTNTVGTLQVSVNETGALPVWNDFHVLEEDIYDALFAASAAAFDSNQRVDVGAVLGTAQTAGDIMGSLGEENASAAAGDPSTTESVMQYVKQLVNVLVGSAGVATFPAEAAPADSVSLSEVLRAIHADVTGLNGDSMRGTDGANTTTPPTAAAVADAIWDEAQADHVAAGSFGEIATEIAAVLVDTDSTIPGLIAALNNLSAADVNAQVLDVLNTDTFAEPTGVPAATVTLATKIGFLYMALRNQIDITSSAKTFYDDGGATEWKKAVTDNGTTYSEAEASAP